MIIFWIIGRITNTFQWFKVSSTANEPTLKMGSRFFASNFKDPQRFNFICFQGQLPETGKFIAVYRLCGMEGDVVEIRDGDLYVDNKMVDDQLDLIHKYSIAKKDYSEVADLISVTDVVENPSGDSVYAMINTELVKTKKIRATRVNLSKDYFDKDISDKFFHSWNQDHFGPVTVPASHYFALGDNRNSAADSRYQGFIPKEKLVATVLWKK